MAPSNRQGRSPRHAREALLALQLTLREFGPAAGERKFALLHLLAEARLPSAAAVLELHDALCYLRAYPDHAALLDKVVLMLDRFDQRDDFLRHRGGLRNSGIVGTTLRDCFFAVTAFWLSKCHPGALRLVWDSFEQEQLLSDRLAMLATWPETPGLDEVAWELPRWLQRLAGEHQTDADFLLARIAGLGGSEQQREAFLDELGFEFELRAAPGTPSRSRALLHGRPLHYQSVPLPRERPDLRVAVAFRAREIHLSERNGTRLIALARQALVIRQRDLDAFAYGDPRDVRLLECGNGLEFAVIGMKPERRLLLEGVYGLLTLKNGVPIGYLVVSSLFASSEIAFNVFDPWRGGEAAEIYGKVLAVTQQLFGADTFAVFPYQLGGGGNDEGLQSGAWWFYQKLGFRARDPEVLATMQRELALAKRKPKHRTNRKTLARIAEHSVYWSSKRARNDILGIFSLGALGVAVTDYLARRFGSAREAGLDRCAREVAEQLSVRDLDRWDRDEQRAFRRWSPLVQCLTGLEKWDRKELVALAEVMRSKGGRRESDYVLALNAHQKLRAALCKLAARTAL